ncbi:hypothetical protein MCOR27_004306 [Pyricularia oryzae]|uniref:Retinol dehydrogenase 13 n=5 Tax=Pyricularia TaxID=48558 RepID=A0ABQ8P0G6_PYRGI|nr:retinol dehydrogenase 13 [Pyricularia oryzae 70-15]ELQ38092.1 retinol dehydrogenase 13 [Pyricularia oryzae Y34]KAH8846748.1 hypothetical protein MCOR01_000195 [Pyricularia oryzae]KAI6304784.1 hypothetical protein MCOR33_000296 [Pyricularia grisea]EHA51593.1 retinol dehydrogenase 13 [Pyricularia oryzae 70-15]KAH9428091.1 hypothetical protein MCOR02_011584 [Pyricularia oryzae]
MAYGAKTTGSAIVGDYASQIANKTILTTGVSPTTLGAAFVTTIATASPALLILAGRNLAKAEETAEAIRAVAPQVPIRTLELDLADKQSVRKAAATVLAWDDVAGIDVLVNNAAIITDEYGTIEGIERVFAVNHLGPFLFTNLVLPKVLAVKGRVVNVASEGHRFSNVRFMDLNFEDGKIYNKWRAYGQSKTANMLFSLSLARKLGSRGLVANSPHPGTIITPLSEGMDLALEYELTRPYDQFVGYYPKERGVIKTLDEGISTHIYAAFEPSLKDHNGTFLLDCHVADPNVDFVMSWAASEVEAEKLWKLSEELVGEKFEW